MAKNMHGGHRDRMKGKVLSGVDHLYDHEILEILLYKALPRVDTNPVAHALLDRFGNLQNIFRAGKDELMSVKGVGESAAAFLILIGELNRRIDRIKPKKVLIANLRQGKRYAAQLLEGRATEQLIFVYMDEKGCVVHTSSAEGASDRVYANLKDMLLKLAALDIKTLLIAHNHPSGCARPSAEDAEATERIRDVCAWCGVTLYDHIIVAKEESYSFREEGRL